MLGRTHTTPAGVPHDGVCFLLHEQLALAPMDAFHASSYSLLRNVPNSLHHTPLGKFMSCYKELPPLQHAENVLPSYLECEV